MGIDKTYNDLVINHYENNWGGGYKIKKWKGGPMEKLSKEFCLLVYPPNMNRKMWTYATCGMSSLNDDNPIELHIFSSTEDDSLLELLTAVCYYHKKDAKLNLNHTVNFGIPWQTSSKCTYGLISLPYLDGPKLEILKMNHSVMIHFYWLIPITPEELNYKKIHGVEYLEQKFDQNKLDYLNPTRLSVI